MTMAVTGRIYYILKDHLGSTRAVMDVDWDLVSYYDYMPFGNTTGYTSQTYAADYQYTSQEWDGEVGLHNYRARLYDSDLGRFYAVDPAGQFASPYLYAGNNPVIMVDPDGEWFLQALALGYKVYKYYTIGKGIYNTYQAYQQGGLSSALPVAFNTAYQYALSEAMPQLFSVGIDNNPVASMVTGSINGAINGFIYSVMTGGDIKDGVSNGARYGGVMGFITSQNFVNLMEGEGFNNDLAVFNKYKNSEDPKWQMNYTNFNNSKYGVNTVYNANRYDSEAITGRIELGNGAFESYGDYITTLDHELYHYNNPHSPTHNWHGGNTPCTDCEINASRFVLSNQGLYRGINVSNGINRQLNYYTGHSGYPYNSFFGDYIPLRVYVRLLW